MSTLGDPRLVLATFIAQDTNTDRNIRLDLGGGALLNIGIYVVQFACLVFKEMPESITAVGNKIGGKGVSRSVPQEYLIKNNYYVFPTFQGWETFSCCAFCLCMWMDGRMDIRMDGYMLLSFHAHMWKLSMNDEQQANLTTYLAISYWLSRSSVTALDVAEIIWVRHWFNILF